MKILFMKHLLFIITFTITIFLFGCNKDSISKVNPNYPDLYTDSALNFLKSKFPNDFGKLDLNTIKSLRYKNEKIGLQIFQKSSPTKFLLLKKDISSYSGNWVDLSQLKKSKSGYYNGIIQLNNLITEGITRIVIDSNKVINGSDVGYKHANIKDTTDQTSSVLLPEIIVVIYQPSIDFLSLYWLLSQTDYYSDLYLQDYYPGGGYSDQHSADSGLVINNVAAMPVFISPANPIVDLKKEIECFTNSLSSTYSITVNVNQPNPDTRDKINPFSDFKVGHTFFTLQQTNPDGSIIVRNIGFYPKDLVMPGSSVSQSIFGEDSKTPFDVSLKISVSASEFNTVINSLINQQSHDYDLNTFNCVNSAMDALGSIYIYLPASKSGDQLLFSGYNPGDLGQDIRNLDLNNFSQLNGNRKITRKTSNDNNQTAPAKAGTC